MEKHLRVSRDRESSSDEPDNPPTAMSAQQLIKFKMNVSGRRRASGSAPSRPCLHGAHRLLRCMVCGWLGTLQRHSWLRPSRRPRLLLCLTMASLDQMHSDEGQNFTPSRCRLQSTHKPCC